MNVRLVSPVEHIFYRLRWDEINALAVSYNKISRHHRDAANPNRNIDAGEHDVSNGCGVDRPKVSGHVNFRNSVEVAHAAVHDQPAAVGGLHHIVEQIVSNDGSVDFLAEQIDHQHVSRLQHVDRS